MIWHTEMKKGSLKGASLLLPPKPVDEKKDLQQKGEQPPPKFKDLLRLYWQQYCEKSSIHGVRYIYDTSLRSIERLIWTALVVTFVTLTCISYISLAERYSSQKLQTVVENSQYPVFKISFPAVGVCTNNRINWQRLAEAKSTFLPPNPEQSLVDIFTTFVERMETMKFGHFESFADMDDINLEALDHIDITNLTKFMSFRCEDIFVPGSCRWRRVQFDCCSAFVMERTELGYCLVFNSIVSEESWSIRQFIGPQYYPYHASKAGQGTGLHFNLKTIDAMKRPDTKASDTITILIKRPEHLSNNGYTITPGTETYVVVRPEITESDDNIRALSQRKRNCFFNDEITLPTFNTTVKFDKELILGNCVNVCHEEHIKKYCNCTLPPFFLATDDSAERCRASHFRCLAKNTEIFSYDKKLEEDAYFSAAKPGMTCACLVPCNIIEYYTSLTTLPLSADEVCNKTELHSYEVDVHYQSEVFIRYRTSLEFTSIDLIANFGGIFGLCLGASMVSAVELLYYLTFGFVLYLYDNHYFAVFKQHSQALRMRLRSLVNEAHEEHPNATNDSNRKASFQAKRPHANKW